MILKGTLLRGMFLDLILRLDDIVLQPIDRQTFLDFKFVGLNHFLWTTL